VVVELINDTQAAWEIVSAALKSGKAVVSASKRMIAENLRPLYELQQKHHAPLLYEAACCASIPIIRNLEEYYDNDLLNGVEGVCNGSSNFILTRIEEEHMNFGDALRLAQEKGFAETDPTLDVEGYDPKFKLCILLLHAFGTFVKPADIFHFGISRLNGFDIDFARHRNAKIKLIAKCHRQNGAVVSYVLPHLVGPRHLLGDVSDEYNGILVESSFAENQFFVGKGAGGTATGSAVLSDISALTYNYHYEYKKIGQATPLPLNEDVQLKIYLRYQKAGQIDQADFIAISEKYESADNCYIVATIALKKLKEATWLSHPEVNLLVLEP
jgi:homoserine dehydrogenase